MRKLVLALVVSCLAAPHTAGAWNMSGHKAVAAVAYLNLDPGARTRVDALLRQHPDFALLSQGLLAGDPDFGLRVFMRAAEWPDVIRNDSRFFDDGGSPTSPLPGFPDMGRHQSWHFVAQGFSTDGTLTVTGTDPGALTQIVALQATLGDPAVVDSTEAYNLGWLLHLVGDIHQPLHSISRFSALHTSGDRGGNSFRLSRSDSNLHSFWDNVLTREEDADALADLARELMAEVAADQSEVALGNDPRATVNGWMTESVVLSKYVAYTVGEERSSPIGVPRAYRRLAQEIARHRAVIAGYRLADLLNTRLP